MSGSIHDKLKNVRPSRVEISYKVESNGAQVTKELPFVVGVLGDYSGDNSEAKSPLRDRKVVGIDRDNFDDVMQKINPKVNLKVDNTLEGDGSQMGVELEFNSIEDFEPHKIVDQVEPLRKLLETRNKLRDLLTKADRSDELESLLEEVLSNTDALANLSNELGVNKEGENKDGE